MGRKGSINSSGKTSNVKRNDLFQILKEEGVICHSAENVDEKLEKLAKKWVKEGRKRQKKQTKEEDMIGSTMVLVVVSGDSDFVPLLEYAKSQEIVVVSANPQQGTQTKALIQSSDIVLVDSPSEEEGIGNDADHDRRLVATAVTQHGNHVLKQLEASDYFSRINHR